MAAIIEVLREEHRNIGRLLRALEYQIEAFAREEPTNYDVVVGVAEYFLGYPDRCHHLKEDLILSDRRSAPEGRRHDWGFVAGTYGICISERSASTTRCAPC